MNNNGISTLRKEANGVLLDLTADTNWVDFLRGSVFTYKYPFSEQLQIHTQASGKSSFSTTTS